MMLTIAVHMKAVGVLTSILSTDCSFKDPRFPIRSTEASPEAQSCDFGFVQQHTFSDGDKGRIQRRLDGDFDRSLGSG